MNIDCRLLVDRQVRDHRGARQLVCNTGRQAAIGFFRTGLDGADDVETVQRPAPDGVLLVELIAGLTHQEELGVGGVRFIRARHGGDGRAMQRPGFHGAGSVHRGKLVGLAVDDEAVEIANLIAGGVLAEPLHGVFRRFAVKHCFELDVGVRRRQHVDCRRFAALRHEVVDDAVEWQAVVVTRAGDLLDLLDMGRSEIGTQFDQEVLTLDGELQQVFRIDLAPVGRIVSRASEGRASNREKRCGGQQIAKAETPGPTMDKITPKMSDSAKILYIIYISITLLEVLLLLAGGMSLFDAFIQTFGSMGTGGFSNYNASIGYFNSVYIDIVIGIFIIIAGANFNLYYDLVRGRWRDFLGDHELRLYLGILAVAMIAIAANLWYSGTYDSFFQAFRYSFFQSASIMTTTGYASTNFDLWPTFSKMVLFTLMFIGGCSASTAGSVKVIRVLIVFKLIKRELFRKMHPRAVVPIKVGGRPVASGTVSSIASFMFLYFLLFFVGTLLISLEDFGLATSASAVAATLGNVGPGFDLVGPALNYSIFTNASKLLMSFLMLAGRLELFTVILLFTPGFWDPDR